MQGEHRSQEEPHDAQTEGAAPLRRNRQDCVWLDRNWCGLELKECAECVDGPKGKKQTTSPLGKYANNRELLALLAAPSKMPRTREFN